MMVTERPPTSYKTSSAADFVYVFAAGQRSSFATKRGFEFDRHPVEELTSLRNLTSGKGSSL